MCYYDTMNVFTTVSRKRFLIVGGGRGIGQEIVQTLLMRGDSVIVADRMFTPPRCGTPEQTLSYLPIDLSLGNVDPLCHLDIQGLIVTAGVGRLAWLEDFSPLESDRTFQVNCLSIIKLLQAYLPHLQSERPFTCAVITSISALVASPLYTLYSATKAALYRFIEGCNAELAYKGCKNRILNIAPGYIGGTSFHGSSRQRTPTEQESLTALAQKILCQAEAHQTLYIPRFDEVYAGVLQRYYNNPARFAQESLSYKLASQPLVAHSSLKIGYLTGSFDLFHIGHLNLIRNARKQCDILIVGVHRDGSHKGKTLFIPLEERMAILQSLRYVDQVIECSQEDMDDWPKLHFHRLFVGSDYQGSNRFKRYETIGKELGVEIIYLPYTTTTSSSQLRALIQQERNAQ